MLHDADGKAKVALGSRELELLEKALSIALQLMIQPEEIQGIQVILEILRDLRK